MTDPDIKNARERAAKLDPADSRRIFALNWLSQAEELLATGDTSRDVQFQIAHLITGAEAELASPPGLGVPPEVLD